MQAIFNSPVAAAIVTGIFGSLTFLGGYQIEDHFEEKRRKVVCAVDRTDLTTLEQAFTDFSAAAKALNGKQTAALQTFSGAYTTGMEQAAAAGSFMAEAFKSDKLKASLDKLNESVPYFLDEEQGQLTTTLDSVKPDPAEVIDLRVKRSAAARVFNTMADKINNSCAEQK